MVSGSCMQYIYIYMQAGAVGRKEATRVITTNPRILSKSVHLPPASQPGPGVYLKTKRRC